MDNDISYVYSGYAPLSIRLVQAITQKGALLGIPSATDAPPPAPQASAATGEQQQQSQPERKPKSRAHPIVGWKGFEEVVTSFPGEVFDLVQTADGPSGIGGTDTNPGLSGALEVLARDMI